MDKKDKTPVIPEMGRVKRIHFVGIGGAGMSGIAEVLFEQGYAISGSDLVKTNTTRRLEMIGITVFYFHDKKVIEGADVLVVSSAIETDNPELIAAAESQIPVVPRAEMLGELMRYRHGIAVSGTHGKTTTTSLITDIFERAGFMPTFVIGGQLNSVGLNARLGKGKYLIAEADESDASFRYLHPMIAVVTNIDKDHLGTYDNDFNKLKAGFLEFLGKLPFYGSVVACIDDPVVKGLLPFFKRRTITFGITEEADFRAKNIVSSGLHSNFSVERRFAGPDLEVELSMPGKHNILNALAAIAVASEENIADEQITSALKNFSGVGRRFQVTPNCVVAGKSLTLIDDYGHHPTEVMAVINTVRDVWPESKLIMVYQPHRYTRTAELFSEFVSVLSLVDELILLDVYSAGEKKISGATSFDLIKAIEMKKDFKVKHARDIEDSIDILESVCRADDIVLIQGAGNVSLVSRALISQTS